MKFKRFLAVAIIGTMTFSLAACSSNEGTGNSVSTEQNQSETESEFNTMVVSVNELNGIFNPLFYTTAFDSYVFGPVFSSVSILDDDNNLIDDAGNISQEEIKDEAGNTTQVKYTIKLKDGVTFSDGKPVTIDHYIFTLKV